MLHAGRADNSGSRKGRYEQLSDWGDSSAGKVPNVLQEQQAQQGEGKWAVPMHSTIVMQDASLLAHCGTGSGASTCMHQRANCHLHQPHACISAPQRCHTSMHKTAQHTHQD
jgi:hypothetical protein